MFSYQKFKDFLKNIFLLFFHTEKVRKRFYGSCENIFWAFKFPCLCTLSVVITQLNTAEGFWIVCAPFMWFLWSAWVAVAFTCWQWLSLASVSCCVPVYTKPISVPRPETLTWADRDEKCRVGRNKKRTLTEASCSHYRTQPPPTSADVFLMRKTKCELASSKHI